MDNGADPVQVDAVRATIRHMRDAELDEGFKPDRDLDEVEKEQLARLGLSEDIEPAKPKATKKGDSNG